jgi:hypothetical protein
MSVTRIAATLQPVSVRAATTVVETSSTFAIKMQGKLEQAAAATRAAVLDDQLPNVLVALLTPASMIALVFALWRFTSDIGWTGAFPIADGFFSHWQVWLALAAALKFAASALYRLARTASKTSEVN